MITKNHLLKEQDGSSMHLEHHGSFVRQAYGPLLGSSPGETLHNLNDNLNNLNATSYRPPPGTYAPTPSIIEPSRLQPALKPRIREQGLICSKEEALPSRCGKKQGPQRAAGNAFQAAAVRMSLREVRPHERLGLC